MNNNKLIEVYKTKIEKIYNKLNPDKKWGDNITWIGDQILEKDDEMNINLFGWYEWVLKELIPMKYKENIRKYGNGHLRHKQLIFLKREEDMIDIMYHELFNK